VVVELLPQPAASRPTANTAADAAVIRTFISPP